MPSLFITIFITSSQLPIKSHYSLETRQCSLAMKIDIYKELRNKPLIFSTAESSLGVHCRLTMYSEGLFFLGLSIHQRHAQLLSTLRLVPIHIIISADSAAARACSQLYGDCIPPCKACVMVELKIKSKKWVLSET